MMEEEEGDDADADEGSRDNGGGNGQDCGWMDGWMMVTVTKALNGRRLQ